MNKYNIKDIKNWYGESKMPTFLCIHIETKWQHKKLKTYMSRLTGWSNGYPWYLQSGGYSNIRSSYENNSYLIIEFDDIIFEQEYEIY